MKKILLSITVSLLSFFTYAQNTSSSPLESGAKISFEKEVHDFGTLPQGGNATTKFKFTNTGNAPLIISNAKGSCGCTVPKWPKEPIAPGKSSFIDVKYDSKRIGPINKSVIITSNAKDTPTKVIRIKGKINSIPSPLNKNNTGAPIKR